MQQVFEHAQKLARDQSALTAYMAMPALVHPIKAMHDGTMVELHKNIANGIETIIGNLRHNKYLFSILITCLVKKLVDPNQDVRIAQANLNKGYSNRSTDQIHVTPFLREHGLTHCAASGMESGRNFERPYPLNLDYEGKPNGKGNKEAFLGILHAIEEEGIDAKPCLILLMAMDLSSKDNVIYEYPKPKGLTVEELTNAIKRHQESARGNGRACLPVLAIQAIYQCLVQELTRYTLIKAELRNPPNRHTGNDKKGWIGDIQVDYSDGTPFEAVEVKSEKQVTTAMVNDLSRKFAGSTIDRYYILSTSQTYIAEDERESVEQAVIQMHQKTGCQIIVNGLHRSLWYYLRLLADTNEFLVHYTEQIQTDKDVKAEHREAWSEILLGLAEPKDV